MKSERKTLFAARIREIRGDKTQQFVADLVGVHKNAWWRWETEASEPDLATLVKIAKTFSVSTDWLIGVVSENEISQSGNPTQFPSAGMKKRIRQFKQKAELAVAQATAFLKTVEEIEEGL